MQAATEPMIIMITVDWKISNVVSLYICLLMSIYISDHLEFHCISLIKKTLALTRMTDLQ